MVKKCIPSEGLKIIACAAMLLDHIGLSRHLGIGFRVVGRIAFPLYCFLLVEGLHYTKNRAKYAMRLVIAMLISELPFDFAFRGGITWDYQNVLLTILLGFFCLQLMEKTENAVGKLLICIPFLALAELMRCDYGAPGVMMILIFGLAREYDWGLSKLALGLGGVSLCMGSVCIRILGLPVPIELFSLFSLVPLWLYSGKKVTDSPWVQWAFYLFYPVHLLVLALV